MLLVVGAFDAVLLAVAALGYRSPILHAGTIFCTALVVLVVILWTELTSNVASAATFMPILAALATTMGQPVVDLVVPAAVAASCAFMLPVGTAPNAIVYGSGRVRMRDMVRAGLLVNILAWAVIIAVAAVTLPGFG